MKNRFPASLIAIALIAVLACSLVACKTLTPENGFDIIQTALENSLSGINRDIYYAKLTTVSFDEDGTKHTKITTINVLADEENYEIIVNPDGSYSNLRAEITISEAVGNTEAKTTYCAKYGKLSGGEKAFIYYDGNNELSRDVITDADFFSYSAYLPFSMNSLLSDTKFLEFSDLNFNISQYDANTKGKVTTVTFAVNDSYSVRHLQAFGTPSPFDVDYVTVEVSYDRIQSVTAYKREPGFEDFPDAIAIDYETYKLEISYRGPKISANI